MIRTMRLVPFAALGFLFALTGCFTMSGRTGTATADAQAIWQHCEERRETGQIKTHVAAVECGARPVLGVYEGAAYPFMDLVYLSIQARNVGAGRTDNGDVSDEQYRRDVAALDVRLADEEKRRKDIQLYGGRATPTPPEQLDAGLPSFAPEASAGALAPMAPGG